MYGIVNTLPPRHTPLFWVRLGDLSPRDISSGVDSGQDDVRLSSCRTQVMFSNAAVFRELFSVDVENQNFCTLAPWRAKLTVIGDGGLTFETEELQWWSAPHPASERVFQTTNNAHADANSDNLKRETQGLISDIDSVLVSYR